MTQKKRLKKETEVSTNNAEFDENQQKEWLCNRLLEKAIGEKETLLLMGSHCREGNFITWKDKDLRFQVSHKKLCLTLYAKIRRKSEYDITIKDDASINPDFGGIWDDLLFIFDAYDFTSMRESNKVKIDDISELFEIMASFIFSYIVDYEEDSHNLLNLHLRPCLKPIKDDGLGNSIKNLGTLLSDAISNVSELYEDSQAALTAFRDIYLKDHEFVDYEYKLKIKPDDLAADEIIRQ